MLDGGSTATIEWTPDAPLPREVEEWEAFLSVDGGRYYAVRITPHLDAGVRRFRFPVPNIHTSDARLLLRFGDEKRETEVELPERFSIRAMTSWSPSALTLTDREGERGTAMWVDGARDGSASRLVAHRTPSCDSSSLSAIHLPSLMDAESSECAALVIASQVFDLIAAPRRRAVARCVLPSHDRLLDTMRLNI